jgi:hypothetical protein
MQSTNMIMGLQFSEFITLIGIIAGPTIAVTITLANEHFRRRRDERMQVLRYLLATRATPADPNYNGAINLVPVYFNKHSKVMTAWRGYIDAVRFNPAPGDEPIHSQQVTAKQTALIFSILNALHLQLSESEIQTEAYISSGFVMRDTIYINSLQAMPQIAAASQRSATAAERMLDLLANSRPPNKPEG